MAIDPSLPEESLSATTANGVLSLHITYSVLRTEATPDEFRAALVDMAVKLRILADSFEKAVPSVAKHMGETEAKKS